MPRNDSRIPYLILTGLFAVAIVYQARHSWAALELLLPGSRQAAVRFDVRSSSNLVAWLDGGVEQAGLRRGDAVVAVNGRPYSGRSVLSRALAVGPPGGKLHLSVRRDGMPLELDVPMHQFGAPPAYLVGILDVLSPWLCLFLGFGVAALRPRDHRAWLLLLLLLGFSQFAGIRTIDVTRFEDVIRPMSILYRELFQALWPVGMLLFGIYFPEQLEWERRRVPWVKWVIVALSVSFAFARAVLALLDSENYAAAAGLDRALRPVAGWMMGLNMLAVGIFFACVGAKGGITQVPDAKRRLKLLYWGASFGLTPMWLVFMASLFLKRGFSSLSPWLVIPASLLLVLFPLTLAYVIVVERALDVRVVVRQGLQYALAQRGVRIIQGLASALVLTFAVSLAADSTVNRPNRIRYIALGVMFVALAQRLAERMRGVIDRRFFREAVRAEHVLSELSDEVRTIVETDKLLGTVSERLSDALHVPRVAALLGNGGGYRVAHAFGYGSPPSVTFASAGPTLSRLREAKDALRVYFDDPQSWVNGDDGARAERPALEALQSQLLLPLNIKDRTLGFLSLGPKQSEEPYSPSDVRLLRSVAGQTALALENSRLTAQVASEVARAARMSREVEIAHEVQEQLFPHDYPKIPGLDFCGHCRPAAGVGGDYYDFIELSAAGPGLGIAIGDVAGKGIPAALLMAGLQASLRGQTLAGARDLAQLMDRVNRLVSDASPANRYATFFYGQYDAATRKLAYVNAGHNAPMVFRGSGPSRQVLRLSEGGPVVGLIYPALYQQFEVTLEPGDLLLGFTDGISECMSPAEEEWGEERMIAAVDACRDAPAAQVIESLMQAADAFANGAKQHDDMTLVVVRIL